MNNKGAISLEFKYNNIKIKIYACHLAADKNN